MTAKASPRLPEMVQCESCGGIGQILEEGETPANDYWRRCMDYTGTGEVPAASQKRNTDIGEQG